MCLLLLIKSLQPPFQCVSQRCESEVALLTVQVYHSLRVEPESYKSIDTIHLEREREEAERMNKT